MERSSLLYRQYVEVLQEELLPAMGCTEPIAIAFAAAKAQETLGRTPQTVSVQVSGNILKNAKSVVVPGTGGLKGVEAAAAAGIIAGRSDRLLEVISQVSGEDRVAISDYLNMNRIAVENLDSGRVFDILVSVAAEGDTARVRICQFHTNLVLVEKNGERLLEKAVDDSGGGEAAARAFLNLAGILDFADTADIADIEGPVGRQIACNSAIAAEGLAGDYGANIGRVLLKSGGDSVAVRARAMAAAGSDARMNGSELPVVIVSGSGNQGITACLPVTVYAAELGKTREETLRAVALADLITIHQKTQIGRLSAYCGAVSAGAAAGAGIAYLMGGGYDGVAHTLVNALAVVSGMICDGAKPSCAAKIASSVDAGLLGLAMYHNGQQFCGGDGIVTKGAEATLKNVGRLGREGMRETDREIIRIMLGSS